MSNTFYPGQLDYIDKLNALWDLANSQSTGIVQAVTVALPLVKTGTPQVPVISLPASDSSTNGYMTSAQALKLAQLNNYVLPVATSAVLGGVKIGAGILVTQDGTIAVGGAGASGTVTSVQPAAGSNITIINQTTNPVIDVGVATQALKGMMSPADKIKLDSIPGAGTNPISDTPPTNPFPGQPWIKQSTGIEYTWFFDGQISAWVEL
jgi:hypothetical protein